MRTLLLRTLRSYSTKVAAEATAAAAEASTKQKSISSIAPAGTVLKGLNVYKKGEDPVAKSEEEYPEWLWEVLDEKAQKAKLESNPEKEAARERRQANRKLIKSNNFLASMSK